MTQPRDTADVINTRGTAATRDVQTIPTDVTPGRLLAVGAFGLDSELGTAATLDVQTTPTDTTAGALLNNETTSIGGQVNYTGANFQPDIVNGIGVAKRLRQLSGAGIPTGGTVAGNLLLEFTADTLGTGITTNALNAAHTYMNTMGITIDNGRVGDFARIS